MKRIAALALAALATAACAGDPASPGTRPLSAPASVNFSKSTPIAGSYVVVFNSDVTDVDGEAVKIASRHGAKIKYTYKAALKGIALELSDAEVSALRAEPSVAYVEQDQTMSATTIQSGATWGIDRIDQRALPLSGTYTYNADGTGVTVYIIDTGINFTHVEYAGRASTGIDEVTSGGTAADCNGHGSHVSGTVAGTTYGVAKNAKLVAVRVLDCSGSGSTTGVIAGIDWVTANHLSPAAANMSLGGGFSSALNTAVTNSIASGVTYAIAAGNSTADACNSSPASAPNAITVGATDINDAFASFSNFGTCVDINGPGVNITSAWMGSNTATNTISGTSMATPHVAGAAALYLQVNRTATPQQVRDALVGNGTNGVIKNIGAGTPNVLLYSGFISAGPQPPVANFTSSCSMLACNFDGSSSTAAAGATYSWTFGDASSGSGVTTSHSYAASGTYSVTLTVTDANGTSSKTSSVTVSNAPVPPVASFTKSCSGLTCSFNASATTNATSYAWNFGDGTTGTGVTASHTFTARTNYTVTLTATGAGGSSTSSAPVTCNKRNCS
ncbi:S8 family peptidase [soil metagenome]